MIFTLHKYSLRVLINRVVIGCMLKGPSSNEIRVLLRGPTRVQSELLVTNRNVPAAIACVLSGLIRGGSVKYEPI